MDTSQQWQSGVIRVIKPTFYNVVLMHEFDYPTLQEIAKIAGVEQSTINDMFTCVAIHRVDALKILAAFSEYTRVTWTFENVTVALLPTFADIVESYKLDTVILAKGARVPVVLVDIMLCNEPVPEQDARSVLRAATDLCQYIHTLENVDVALLPEVAQP